MKKCWLLTFLMTMAGSAAQAVPPLLNFQGRIRQEGQPADGQTDMVFRLFNDPEGGSPIFAEPHTGANGVSVAHGVFNVLIGGLTPGGIPAGVFDGADKYVEVQVGRDVLPRQRMTSVGYAFHSAVADSLVGGAMGPSVSFATVTVSSLLVAGELSVAVGADGVFTSAARNAITFTQPSGSPSPQIRTAAPGLQGSFATATGSTPLNLNAGSDGVLYLNPVSSGPVLMSANQASDVGIGTPNPTSKISVFGNESIGAPFASLPAPTDGLIVSGPTGVGTNNPNAMLEVDGRGRNWAFSVSLSSAALPVFRVNDDGSVGLGSPVSFELGSDGGLNIGPSGGLSNPGTSLLEVNGQGRNWAFSVSTGPGIPGTDPVFRVNNDGSLGLGNPVSLAVESDGTVNVGPSGGLADPGAALLEVNGQGRNWAFSVNTSPSGQGSGPALRVNDDGSVGLGVPVSLEVGTDGTVNIGPSGGGSNPGAALLGVNGQGRDWAFSVSTGPGMPGTEPAFRVNNDGSLGLGAPGQFLTISNTGDLNINPGPFGGSAFAEIDEPLYVQFGNVGIGTTTPGSSLTVESGDVATRGLGSGLIVKSPDGSKCARIGIDNSGAIATTPVACP